jgi:F-type H+-transporting ATPase subunit epsilon
MANDAQESAARAPDKIDFEVVTPKGRALKVVADEVTAPSVNGEFGVLPGHLPLLAALHTGLISYRQGGETKRAAIGRGFAEAGPDRMVILTDRYVEREAIDPVLVRKDLAELQEKLAKVASDSAVPPQENAELDDLIREENWLAAQLELYGDPPPAMMRPFETYGPLPGADEADIPEARPELGEGNQDARPSA